MTALDLQLAGKTVIVTGAGRGLGRAIAETFLALGANVVANDLAPLAYSHGRLRAHSGDIGTPETGEKLVEAAVSAFGRLDVLVHNAGVTTRNAILDTPFADWERVMRTNLYGAYFSMTAAARTLRDQGAPGALVAISSIHGRVAKAEMGAYCTTKAGLDMMVRQLAVELAPNGIRVNAVAPGTIDTGMNPIYHATDPESVARRERLMDRVPMRRLGALEDVARLVAFVASPLSAYTTGAVIYADGGYTADGTPR